MTLPITPESESQATRGGSLRWTVVCAGGLLVLGVAAGALTLPGPVLAMALAGCLLMSALATAALALSLGGMRLRAIRRARSLLQYDPAPGFVSDRGGQVLWWNDAARQRYPAPEGGSLLTALGDVVAHPAALLLRLGNMAVLRGIATEDVVTRAGVLRILAIRNGRHHLIWRLDTFQERGGLARGAEGLSLPVLVAGQNGAVLYANEALRLLTGGRPRNLQQLFNGRIPVSGSVATVTGAAEPVQAVVIELPGAQGRREIYLLPLTALPALAALPGLEDLPLALLRLGADGQVLASNAEARQILSLEPGEQVNASALFDGPGRPLRDWISDVEAGRAAGKTETLRLRRETRADSFVRLTLRPWGGAGRNGLLALLVDATEIRSLEAQFTQSQKMQLIGQLAGGIAHDFNNLLTAISGHCDLLLLRHDEMDPDHADLAQIRQNANRAAALVGQLLAFSRKQTLNAEYLYLQDVVRDMTQLLTRLVGGRMRLECSHDGPGDLIRADRRQLEQVLMNLVVNARDAMKSEGTVRIHTSSAALETALPMGGVSVPAGCYARLQVRDKGPGIPADAMAKIFEPFYTTKPVGEGTGLGLSTAYGIVKQSGGFIFVENCPDGGAEFTVWLPAHQGDVVDLLPAAAPPGAGGAGQSVARRCRPAGRG